MALGSRSPHGERGSIDFDQAEPFDGNPSLPPGLPRPVGWRVRTPDGTEAYYKFGTGDTDWTTLPGTDVEIGGPASVGGAAALTLVEAGDSLVKGNNDERRYSILRHVELYLNHWRRRAGLSDVAYVVTAQGGKTTSDALTNVGPWFIAPAGDGNVVFANYGVNNIIVGPHSVPLSQGLQDLEQIYTQFFAARPNSLLIWLSAIWSGSERWGLVGNTPVGIGSFDADIRAQNDAFEAFTNDFASSTGFRVRWMDLYGQMFEQEAANNLPLPGAVNGQDTVDGVHPGYRGAKRVADVIWTDRAFQTAFLPPSVVPASQADFCDGDWYLEADAGFGLKNQNHAVQPFTRFENLSIGQLLPLGLAATADGGVEGGALKFTTATVTPLTSNIYLTPFALPQYWAFYGSFTAAAANASAFFGMYDAAGANGLGIGVDKTVGGGAKFIVEEIKGGVRGTQPTSLNFDNTPRLWLFMYDANPALRIYDVYAVVSGALTQVLHTNPLAPNFPVLPIGLAAAHNLNGGFSTVSRARYRFNEP